MIIFYCPNCWNEVKKEIEVCENCGYNIKEFINQDYEFKLINALNHPFPQVKMQVVNIILKNKIQKAMPALTGLLNSSNDIYLQKAIIEALGELKPENLKELISKFSENSNSPVVSEAAKKYLK